MFAGTDEITETMADKLIFRRHFLYFQSARAKQVVNVIRVLEHFERAGRIGPGIARRLSQQHRTRRNERNQTILIERKPVGFVVEFFELGIEPMWKTSVDGVH